MGPAKCGPWEFEKIAKKRMDEGKPESAVKGIIKDMKKEKNLGLRYSKIMWQNVLELRRQDDMALGTDPVEAGTLPSEIFLDAIATAIGKDNTMPIFLKDGQSTPIYWKDGKWEQLMDWDPVAALYELIL